jgi:hypothetical protein
MFIYENNFYTIKLHTKYGFVKNHEQNEVFSIEI